ncbi:hypothetical protein LSH36_454g02016 [Paralvinella palmiformis]|uniref:Uncharacterized protein n=1 Tax=Paralvinella palmiformis TaxID=53620 RepID=A0AAD9MXG6_9ANNE|nr:hypothetical protein LSH36_454g02016 [Paralvinella palmiformis]
MRECVYLVPGMAPVCAVISYSQLGERVQGADTTWSILRAMRKASPVFVISLVLLIIAFTLSTLGNAKRDGKTISGAVFYIFSGTVHHVIGGSIYSSALILAVAVILYISAVNDEVSHRKKPASSDSPQFLYRYGWAFFCAGGTFVFSMVASVTNITLYLKRYSRLEDMVVIIPGLHSKSNYDFSKVSSEDEPDTASGSQNPTIIL